MPSKKPLKQNIRPNTADITPPPKGGFIASRQQAVATNKNDKQKDVKKNVLVTKKVIKTTGDIIINNKERDSNPQQQEEKKIKKEQPQDNSGELSRELETKKRESGDNYKESSISKKYSVNQLQNQITFQPKLISFNHAQYTQAETSRLNKKTDNKKKVTGDTTVYSSGQIGKHKQFDNYNSIQKVPEIVKDEVEADNFMPFVNANHELGFYNNREEVTDEKVASFFTDQKGTNDFSEQGDSNRTNHFRNSPEKETNLPNNQNKISKVSKSTYPKQSIFGFALGAVATVFVFGLVIFISFGLESKNQVEVKGAQAINYLKEAKDDLKNKDFEAASTNLLSAKSEFSDSQKQLDKLGGKSLNIFKHLPLLSKISSGKNVIDLGENLTEAVYELSKMSKLLEGLENPFNKSNKNQVSLTKILLESQGHIKIAKKALLKAENASNNIKIADLPENYQEKITIIKDLLPLVNKNLNDSDRFIKIFLEIFGNNGPRRYLIVFENNQEMRATGGFIGSYGLLKTANGKIQDLKIEGIYNPDGQLKINVVPPRPIQKISATWSTHDANWWPDFPKSAQKIAWFYEKTGGPTVDGVIAVTPVLLQKMLEVTGPIEMPQYNKTITAKNFVKSIQQEVEIDYNKKENKPKKILADLTPKLFAKFFDLKNPQQIAEVIKVMLTALEEKHILINLNDQESQKTVEEQGWAGNILTTEGDYLAVINSNINGYKTDGVIRETINHQAEIKPDGTILDTVIITRKHNGGNTDYEWWNKVNSNYMRVYVPQGSQLISVSGQTWEFNEERLVYKKLGFKVDPDVAREEKFMKIDPKSGTRIYDENGKTVFANWVYVSPQEQVTVIYKYKLPFKLNIQKAQQDTYSFLMQKQAGAVNSKLISKVEFPFRWRVHWTEPRGMSLDKEHNILSHKTNLTTDKFLGIVFEEQ
jgi:hypothetical protein